MGDGLHTFLSHPAFQELPAILETPGPGGHGPDADELARLRALHAGEAGMQAEAERSEAEASPRPRPSGVPCGSQLTAAQSELREDAEARAGLRHLEELGVAAADLVARCA